MYIVLSCSTWALISTHLHRGPGAPAPLLADGDVQPAEGGEEGVRAAGARAVPLGLRAARLRHRAGRRPHRPRARLRPLDQGQGGQEGRGRLLRPRQQGEI